ncbi:uncharacterized protein [Erythrolamprus reginae]
MISKVHHQRVANGSGNLVRIKRSPLSNRCRASATITEENNIRNEPFLIDEEANMYIRMLTLSSYPKKMWVLLLKQSSTLWHNTKNGINTVSRIFHMRPLTLPSIKTLLFILLVLLLSSFVLLWKGNGLGIRYPSGNKVTTIVDPIKGGNTKAVPKNLTLTILEEAKASEPFSEAMQRCFDTAIREFMLEPLIVRENAKMTLECNGTRREFVSGKGENYLEVSWVDSQAHYAVKEANSQVFVARLGRQPLPLNLGSLWKVYDQLVCLEGSEEMRQCLRKTIEEFPKEPQAVQVNAVLEVSCGGSHVTFRSEALQNVTNKIHVYKDMQGKVVYIVNARGKAWLARLFRRH